MTIVPPYLPAELHSLFLDSVRAEVERLIALEDLEMLSAFNAPAASSSDKTDRVVRLAAARAFRAAVFSVLK